MVTDSTTRRKPIVASTRRGAWTRITALLFICCLVAAACETGEEGQASDQDAVEGDDEAAEDDGADTSDTEEDEVQDEEDSDGFYAGDDITLLVPFAPGGGSDTTSRFVAPYLGDALGASVQVENVDGGGGIVGSNRFAAEHQGDPNTLYLGAASTNFNYFLQAPGVEYDYSNYEPIMGFPSGQVFSVRPDMGIETAGELGELDGELVQGALAPLGNDVLHVLVWEMLELDVEIVWGYEGRGPTRVAFEQGETNIEPQVTASYMENMVPLIDEGEAIPLFTVGHLEDGEVVRDPAHPDLPSVLEVYEELHGAEPSGEVWDAYLGVLANSTSLEKAIWAWGDVDPEAINELREAAVSLDEDAEFAEERQLHLGDYETVVGDELEDAAEVMTGVDEDVVDWVLDLLVAEHGLDDPR